MSKATSPYYPPRAPWYAPLFNMREVARLGIAMDRIRMPSTVALPKLLLSFLVPGLGFYLRGPRIYGRAALAACTGLFLVFIACLGEPVGNMAFGLMISLHTSGVAYYCGPALRLWPFRERIFLTLLVLTALGVLYYGPLRDIIENHLLMPLRFNGQVVVVQKWAPAAGVKRGDWIAYHISYSSDSGEDAWVHIHSGVGFGPVLGVPGDTIEFSQKGFSVNGVLKPLLPYMPSRGSLVVGQNHWFIWPSYTVSGHGYTDRISSIMLNLANVSEGQYDGKPFKHWLWRKQVYDEPI
jgi:hypothetical protein